MATVASRFTDCLKTKLDSFNAWHETRHTLCSIQTRSRSSGVNLVWFMGRGTSRWSCRDLRKILQTGNRKEYITSHEITKAWRNRWKCLWNNEVSAILWRGYIKLRRCNFFRTRSISFHFSYLSTPWNITSGGTTFNLAGNEARQYVVSQMGESLWELIKFRRIRSCKIRDSAREIYTYVHRWYRYYV